MKTILSVVLFMLLFAAVVPAQEQTFSNFVAAGAGLTDSKQVVGYAGYGKEIAPNTYSYTCGQFTSGKPTTLETGVGRKIFAQGPVTLIGIGTAGAAMGDDNIGAAFGGGALVSVNLPKVVSSGRFLFGVRAQHTSLAGTKYPVVFGLAWGF